MRSDASDGAFEFLGGFWGTDNSAVRGAGLRRGRTEFKLRFNPAGDARFFTVCMSEEGFLKLIGSDDTCADSDYALPPTGNYIAVFATDLDSTRHRFWLSHPDARVRGLQRAVQVVAGGTCHAVLVERGHARRRYSQPAFDVQIVLIDRSNGTNNGNFDIEFNYGNAASRFRPPEPNPIRMRMASRVSSSGPIPAVRQFGPFGPFDTDRRSDSLLLPRRQTEGDLQLTD